MLKATKSIPLTIQLKSTRPTYLHYKTFLYNIQEKSSKFIQQKTDIPRVLSWPEAAQLCLKTRLNLNEQTVIIEES